MAAPSCLIWHHRLQGPPPKTCGVIMGHEVCVLEVFLGFWAWEEGRGAARGFARTKSVFRRRRLAGWAIPPPSRAHASQIQSLEHIEQLRVQYGHHTAGSSGGNGGRRRRRRRSILNLHRRVSERRELERRQPLSLFVPLCATGGAKKILLLQPCPTLNNRTMNTYLL